LGRFDVSHSKSVFYTAVVWVRGALNSQTRRFPASRAAAGLVHYLLLQKINNPRFTIRFRRGQCCSSCAGSRAWPWSSSTITASVRARPGRLGGLTVP
jgi:hypothetical protein